MAQPRVAASVSALLGYECCRCGRLFPETHPGKGAPSLSRAGLKKPTPPGSLHCTSARSVVGRL